MKRTRHQASDAPLWAIGVLSAAALGYEVLLTRLLSIIQWHNFAYMIISLALLGYGASGSLLTLLGGRVRQHFHGFFVINALLFGLTAVGGFNLAQRVPFNALEIAWEPRQLYYLFALYLLLAIPFFAVANCIGSALMQAKGQIHRIYAFDLVGAGLGALGVIALLFVVSPLVSLKALGALGVLAGLIALVSRPGSRFRSPVLLLSPFMVCLALLGAPSELHLSAYKDLSRALSVVGAELVTTRSGPLGAVAVVGNRQVPFRQAPGLSLAATVSPPEQLGLFVDGDGAGVLTRFSGRLDEVAYLDYLTSALPYHLLHAPHTLVLGAGGGAHVLQALYHGAPVVDAVELNPDIVDLVRHEFSDFAGGLYARPEVRMHLAEARGFVAGSPERYDLIQVALLDGFGAAAAGLHALNENYLYTVEAFEQYLHHLKPGGMLALTRWLRLPPRDSLKLFATAVEVLEGFGVADPHQRLMLIRGWKTATLVVKNGPFGPGQIAAMGAFCRTRSFDLAFYPGIRAAEVNRYNVLRRDYLHEGAVAILGAERERFFQRYKYDLRPATDERPYFSRFLKLQVLPELFSLRSRGGLSQLEWGYVILLATLVQAVLAGVVLILLPLWLSRRGDLAAAPRGVRWRVFAYFLLIGLGFLFVEIVFIQKFVLFLSHPLYAIAAVLCSFLVFAGLGSGYSRGLDKRRYGGPARRSVLYRAVTAIVLLSAFYLFLLPGFFHWGLAWPDTAKLTAAIILIAPLAFCMGMPFPLVLGWVAESAPGLVPWAWAINGCASVVSAVLATLLAVEIGFSAVVLIAVGFYLGAAAVAPAPSTTSAALTMGGK